MLEFGEDVYGAVHIRRRLEAAGGEGDGDIAGARGSYELAWGTACASARQKKRSNSTRGRQATKHVPSHEGERQLMRGLHGEG